jgi:hypothetical protein
MKLNEIKAKHFAFIGLAMVGVAIIIAIAFIFNPASREAYLKHESCLERYAEMIYDSEYKTDVKNDIIKNATVTNICGRIAPDPGIENAITNRIIASTAAFLLVIGVVMSLSGTGAWLVSKFKKKK